LFDEENSPRRTGKVARVIRNDIARWTPALVDRKITHLASVIAQMNGGTGPDLLGVCEVGLGRQRAGVDDLTDFNSAELG